MSFLDSMLKHLFSGFLHQRRTKRHFKRQALFETLSRASDADVRTSAMDASQALRRVAAEDVPGAIAHLSSHEHGLTEAEADERRARCGPNEVEHEKPLSWRMHVWHCYKNPFNLLLTLLAGISALTDDMTAAAVIGTMVALSTVIRFVQEGRSNRAAERLKAMVGNTATVIRPCAQDEQTLEIGEKHAGLSAGAGRAARYIELPIRELVPGDHIALSAGDMIPADCRLLTAKDLFVAQAAMTGESLPVEKFAGAAAPFATLFEAPNLVFMGTNVVSGSATALVVATGGHSYFGGLSARVTATDRAPTAFEAGVNSVSWLLIRFALMMVPIVLLINGFTKGDWVQAALFALSVAVGLTPEMLPMIVTSTLAKGAVVMSRKKVIVKRLDAIQNFGAMDVLCTDKTGTLTQDRIALERHIDAFGTPCDEVLRHAYLNSYYQTGLKNLLDHAVLEHVELQHEMNIAQVYSKVDEIPFDFVRRRMSVVVSEGRDHHELICKGAVAEVLSVCSWIRMQTEQGTRSIALDAALLGQVRAVTETLNAQGLRVVAVAMKELPATKSVYSVADEAELTLLGYIAFLDPPKESTGPALRALAEHGVQVKVLTGDSELIAMHVCGRVGLGSERCLLGSEVERMDDETLMQAVETYHLFARLTPQDKERIVRALRSKGHVVGFMGDGINDAPALRAADIGISVDTGVDIAKEAADIILLEKSLMVLEEGVMEGRKTFSNMLKYIRMTASSNFGNVFSVLVGSAFLPFLPMLPLQLLVQNLLYDISQIAIPFDDVDPESIAKPLNWNPADIGRFMVFFGPISSIFDILTYVVMWHVFSANTVAEQSLFQSGWFVVGLLTQTLIVHMIRTPKLPFIQSRAAWPLMLMTTIIMAVGVALPMSPLAAYFKLQALPAAYFPWLIGILLGYALLTTAMKRLYIRRFGWQ